MSTFDTLEIEVTQTCPDPEKIEFGNCGAGDYLAWLFVYAEGGTPENDGGVGDNGRDSRFTEIGRFITSYHRVPKGVPIPADAAIVTGHGNDKNACAEFCNHQHEFTVNGEKHLLDFPESGWR